MNRGLLALLCAVCLRAAEHAGVVTIGGVPVPGATVTAVHGDTKLATITDDAGVYHFADIAEGAWTVQVEMQLLAPQRREVVVAGSATPERWEMKIVPPTVSSVVQRTPVKAERPTKEAPAPPPSPDLAERAADGLLINGSLNNGAASPFAQLPAFGNNRRGTRPMYNGQLGLILNNSLFDARAFSLTGQNTPKPDYSRLQALLAFGGPLKIPALINRNGPMFTLNYQWTRNSNATTATARMPTAEERSGVVSPQARALLELYPLPNFPEGGRYNYQVPIVSGLHQDDLQTRINKQVKRNFFSGEFAMQSTRSDNTDVFGFLDTGRVSGFNAATKYRRALTPRTFWSAGVQLNGLRTSVTPYFANRRDVSGEAGIGGSNRDPVNWGPPALRFASGIAAMTPPQFSRVRNQTASVLTDAMLIRGRHNVMLGYTHRRQQFNVLSQQEARGTFVFTGPDLTGFLLGVPDTASVAYGNADKYLRASISEAYVSDDWRVNPGLTINAGLRWEYWSPVTEKYGRLVNLDVAPGFTSVQPRTGVALEPDRNNFAPRIGFSWRPLLASSMVVRGGYGIYYDTSIYQPIAMQMAQQAPLSRSLRVENSAASPLTLANALTAGAAELPVFAVDPEFRVGYSQTWQLSVQRDLPAALQMTATYSGGKGTRGQQQILPNTFPDGALSPSGFTYLMSNGNSIRHAGQIEMRRRLRSGFTASLQYTWAKSIDNAALGGKNQTGVLTAQNWLDLRAERARSDFDQRHQLSATIQYTTGMGMRGRGLWWKEWTLGSQITAGSGLPLTPVYLTPVRGTGVTGTVRPDYTGAPLYEGSSLNPAAFVAPANGWGNAGRNTIGGPGQFVLNASLGRTFRSAERVTFDVRVNAANAINTVTYTAWNTVVGNPLFGLPVAANAMRSVQVVLRTRF